MHTNKTYMYALVWGHHEGSHLYLIQAGWGWCDNVATSITSCRSCTINAPVTITWGPSQNVFYFFFEKQYVHNFERVSPMKIVWCNFWCNISNMKDGLDCVWPHFQTPRRDLKIRCVAEYFWQTLRCLEMWSNTVLSVW